ncbi:hypothetical protein GmHk_05G012837 [Glycine max]|nr:hypothetical protein GmHk_05G012837 [Glycine max]
MTTQRERGFDLILILGHDEECKKVWETHVLLLASLDTKPICFASPYHPHIDLEAIKDWLPTHEGKQTLIHKGSIRSDFWKDKSGICRVLPPKDRKIYLTWLKCLEAKKAQHWKNINIYDMIQLSKYEVVKPKSTCLRELPYVPVSPTLMDLIAIIGLKPLGKTYSLGLFEDQIERSEVKIDGSAKSYGGFI